jgi:acyl carrier protein
MLKEKDLLNTLTDIFRSELDDETINLTMSTVQSDIVSWDSLAHVRIVMRVESVFGIQFEVDEIEGIHSVQNFFDVISSHLT